MIKIKIFQLCSSWFNFTTNVFCLVLYTYYTPTVQTKSDRSISLQLGAIMQEISERLQMLEQGYLSQGGDDNMSVRSMSYPSSCVSVPQRLISPSPKPSRIFNECQIPHPQNSKSKFQAMICVLTCIVYILWLLGLIWYTFM